MPHFETVAANIYEVPISFPLFLSFSSETAGHFYDKAETEEIEEGEINTGSDECKGSFAKPTAPPGMLCIYTRNEENEGAKFLTLVNPASPRNALLPGFSTIGTIMWFQTEQEPARVSAGGSWAVTAP